MEPATHLVYYYCVVSYWDRRLPDQINLSQSYSQKSKTFPSPEAEYIFKNAKCFIPFPFAGHLLLIGGHLVEVIRCLAVQRSSLLLLEKHLNRSGISLSSELTEIRHIAHWGAFGISPWHLTAPVGSRAASVNPVMDPAEEENFLATYSLFFHVICKNEKLIINSEAISDMPSGS